jgi:hypothetical protein
MIQPKLSLCSIKFDGRLLQRGFWLYVIDIHAPTGRHLYVGRTGDSSSANASSPFARIGQHLDIRPRAKGNALARNLRHAAIDPSLCEMEMLAIGPIFPEERAFASHRPIRDQVAALEHALACTLRERGYSVLGKHSAPCAPDATRLAEIIGTIDARLPKGAA